MKRRLFFLSHVRGADDGWVAQFFHDLSTAVSGLTGLPPDTMGLRADPTSREAPLELMRQAVTLVALETPQYHLRSYCRAEWDYFRQRAEVQRSRTGRATDAIVPVNWVPVTAGSGGTEVAAAPPGSAGERSWPPPLTVAHPAYAKDGLLHLLRLGARFQPVYEDVVATLAARLARRRHETLPDLDGFSVVPATRPAQRVGAAPGVSVVVAAPDRAGLPEDRRSHQYYGASPLDWSPYHPEQPRSLVTLVEETAADLELNSEVVPLDAPAAQDLGETDEDERFVVLLIDAWAATLGRQRQLLAPLDARAPGSTAVLEPRSDLDAESAAHGTDLDRALDQALPRLREAGSADLLRRWGLPDPDEFIVALRRALVSAQNDALKTTANRVDPGVLPAARFGSLPQLGKFTS
ncbi:FxsC-like protein [Streptacidiphilus sp. MAP12-33]|uniref:FxsC protein n=1 Tax=Streptacidiphilus sp. MAP12-33 TaxID=3156266 RepID=UPI00351310AF